MVPRFLEDHRRPLGDYDRLHFDEGEIAALRARTTVQTPLAVHWEWDYVREVESLRALYERGKPAQWNAEQELDWSQEVPEDAWVMKPETSTLGQILAFMGADEATRRAAAREEFVHGLSQLLHGEQAALQLCAQLVNSVEDMDAKLFAGQQVADECRHVEVFSKLLSRKFGVIHPIDPNIKYLLDRMLETDRWYLKAVGMQILFEGIAMAIITDMGVRALNPLVKQVMRLVARDEARHAAFGVLALRAALPGMSQEQRDELEDFTWQCLEVVANGLGMGMLDVVAPRYGLDPTAAGMAVYTSPGFWDGRYHLFQHTVLPNLLRLGIITDRTRSEYARFRLLDASAPHGSRARYVHEAAF